MPIRSRMGALARPRQVWFVAAYAGVLAVTAALAVVVHDKVATDRARAWATYAERERAGAVAAAAAAGDALDRIRTNLRTLALLPSVRQLDRHGTNLQPDGRESIQQLYNNLVSSLAVSEIYIVPVDLAPDHVDPVTGRLEEPILMFDELIVGHEAREAHGEDEEHEHDDGDEPAEVEIEEYRLLAAQMRWLRQRYPDEAAIDGLRYPLLAGPEVVTCDNSVFAKTGVEADRRGTVFSVPFYAPDGRLAGTVSAIVRTEVLAALLPDGDHALVATADGFVAMRSGPGQATRSATAVAAARPDPALAASWVVPVPAPEATTPWQLWLGRPASHFAASRDLRGARAFAVTAFAAVASLGLLLLVIVTVVHRASRTAWHARQRAEARRRATLESLASELRDQVAR